MKAFFENRKNKGESDFVAVEINNISFFAHWHNEIELIYVCEGELGVGFNREYKVIKQGEMAVCEGNEIHYYNSTGQDNKVYMLIFPSDMLSFKSLGIKAEIASSFFGCDTGFDKNCLIKTKIEDIIAESSNTQAFQKQMINIMLTNLFVSLFREQKDYFELCESKIRTGNKQLSAEPMQRALTYIEQNYAEEITLETAADESGLSPYYFSRLFKKTTGTNFNVYLNQVRVDSAVKFIESTDENIIDIALKTGFKSIRTFNRVFKSLKGTTPNKIRQK